MKALEGRNNVKVYNLSAGKSLPEWLTERKRRQLSKRDVDFRQKIELIQDFTMPDLSGCVRMSPDGRYILATGTYKPRVKCYEVASLSLKFERCVDYEVIQFDILSEDYSKLVFLQEERYVEFHSQGGRWFRTRIPKFGRDFAYHYPSCDLYMAAAGSEIYRLNLSQGRFLNSLQTNSPGVNRCEFNKIHYLFTCGTEDGRIEAWDPRSRHRVGVLDCAMHMDTEYTSASHFNTANRFGITALAFNDALTLGVGTQTGQILLYDIRSDKPLLVKDHNDGLPVKDLEFHNSAKMVVSMSSKIVKIWDKETGAPHTSIESEVDFNDLCLVPDSGMLFLATEDVKLQTYFLPSLGTAPRWCSHLDALIEELEEEEAPSQYDDYKFVTEEELKQIGLQDLIGTEMLRAVMHGYYIDSRLYNKAKMIANPFDYDDFMKRKVKQKITEQNQRGIQTKKLPNVNRDLFERLTEEQNDKGSKKMTSADALLKDDRFGALFISEDFEIEKNSAEFKLFNPVLNKMDKKRRNAKVEEELEEQEFIKAREEMLQGESSDSDSIISNSDDEKKVKPVEIRNSKKQRERYQKKGKKSPVKEDEQKKTESKNLSFTAADSLAELKASKKKLSKMTLADRLEMEDDNQESIKQLTFGSREMSYVVKKTPKDGLLRQKQREHQAERRKVRRSTANLKGKFRTKD
ncbi:nucleolar protein 10-like [Penaeus japonicus]|uniref:nucleolar protein 10-like n=1 Tax=Penaeus japonicus TaxID=27405 RepID=UPI001C716346|nr:nucleolar protein 10-like [Penaeus japonicus]XP_042875132.1 nucleolar protein 10-like [Penaeus japonicus]